jgi:hypothetical protein
MPNLEDPPGKIQDVALGGDGAAAVA